MEVSPFVEPVKGGPPVGRKKKIPKFDPWDVTLKYSKCLGQVFCPRSHRIFGFSDTLW